MIFLKTLVFALLTAGVQAVAQTVELDRCMEGASTQAAMNRCAGEEVNRVEALLGVTYQQVQKAAKGDAQALAKIKNAERAWIAYRNAY